MNTHVTVAYKLNGKYHVGILDKNADVDYFERVMIPNPEGFIDNVFHILMVGEGELPEPVEIHRVACNFSNAHEDDMVALANRALTLFKVKTVVH